MRLFFELRAVLLSWTCLFAAISLPGCGDTRQASKSASLARTESIEDTATSGKNAAVNVESREAYDHFVENPFVTTMSQPQSTFAIDVDTASYSNVRRMIREGRKPPKGAVRLEEFVNYFPYSYAAPTSEHPFSVSTEVANCPWNMNHQLLRVGLKGKSISTEESKACNLVFLIDVSGSMNAPNKLPLVQSSLKLLVSQLQPQDRIAIVVYAGASGLVLPSTSVQESRLILDAIDQLQAGGSTNGGMGIELAYKVAKENFIDGGVNRVLICTDGDFNVGVTNRSDLVDLIQTKAKERTFLSVLGFGQGNLQDATMEQLADKGNGNYAYVDSLLEARKVLVEQAGGTLITIASDVKIQIDFNPTHVKSYRLLGYENRKLENSDFRNDAKDAGEIGAGHTVTAFYELEPTSPESSSQSAGQASSVRGSEFVQVVPSAAASSDSLLAVNLRYKLPETDRASEFQVRVAKSSIVLSPSEDFSFATSVLAYGMLLRDSNYAGDATWSWVIENAEKNTGKDPMGLRHEFIQLAKTASSLSR